MNEPEDTERWTEKRAQFLLRSYDVTETAAKALPWVELGYTNSGAAKKIDSTEGTVKKRMAGLEEEFGSNVTETGNNESFDVDHALERERRPTRECPNCEEESINSMWEADRVYSGGGDMTDAMKQAEEDGATHICTSCFKYYEWDVGGGK